MNDFTYNNYSFQLPLFDFHTIRIFPFNKGETTFYKYLATVENLLTSEERTYLFSEPYIGRKGYSGFQILAVIMLIGTTNTFSDLKQVFHQRGLYQEESRD